VNKDVQKFTYKYPKVNLEDTCLGIPHTLRLVRYVYILVNQLGEEEGDFKMEDFHLPRLVQEREWKREGRRNREETVSLLGEFE
jgi:hypothetical protein